MQQGGSTTNLALSLESGPKQEDNNILLNLSIDGGVQGECHSVDDFLFLDTCPLFAVIVFLQSGLKLDEAVHSVSIYLFIYFKCILITTVNNKQIQRVFELPPFRLLTSS